MAEVLSRKLHLPTKRLKITQIVLPLLKLQASTLNHRFLVISSNDERAHSRTEHTNNYPSVPSHAWLWAKDHDEDVYGHEGDERAEIELAAEDGRHDLPAEGEKRVAEVSQGGEGLAVPGDVGKPGEEHPDKQNLPVDPQPAHGRRHGRRNRRAQRREVDAAQANLERRQKAAYGRGGGGGGARGRRGRTDATGEAERAKN